MAFCLSLFAFCIPARAQERESNASSGDVGYSYKFESPRFFLHLIEIDLAGDGNGELHFQRGESDEVIDLKLKLLPATLARIRELFDHAQFLTSSEDYQHNKDFSHLGWVVLSERLGEREREARFNYTVNPDIKELTEIFRAVAAQEIHLFDIDLMQRHQPLDLPRLLEVIESDLRSGRIAEPDRLMPALREISGDDTMPLIARNHALRMVDKIKKGKYKSPVKMGK